MLKYSASSQVAETVTPVNSKDDDDAVDRSCESISSGSYVDR